MANQLMIILWLCCFFLATYGAPFGDGGSPKRSIRARRVIRKAGHRKMGPGRNLVRYRYPIYAKRSSAADWNVDDGNEDFISFLSDQLNSDGTASDFSPLMKANELDMINNDDDKNSRIENATGLGAAAKKRRSFKGQSKFDRQWETETEAEGEEEAEEEEADDIDRRSRRLVANLINQLKEEDLKAATSKMTRELFDAIEEEVGADDRRKKSSLRKRSGPKLNSMKLDVASGNQCVVIEEVMVTCDSLGHLMGGYRSILSDACYRQQACSICVARDQELEPCDVEFQQYTSELCGDDVLCRSQSRRLHSALVKIGAVQDELFKGSMGRIEALCRHDVCLPAFLKRR